MQRNGLVTLSRELNHADRKNTSELTSKMEEMRTSLRKVALFKRLKKIVVRRRFVLGNIEATKGAGHGSSFSIFRR